MTPEHLAWIETLNAKEEAWKRFMDANKQSPMRKEYDEAVKAEKVAKELFLAVMQGGA